MATPETTTSRRAALVAAGVTLLLLGLYCVSVRVGTDPRLLYHQQCPVFLARADFLARFVGHPGGPAEYVSLFLAQFYFYPWVGALVITGVAWLLCIVTRRLVTSMSDAPVPPTVYCVPAVLLLMLFNRYSYHLVSGVALVAALAFADLYVRTAPRRTLARLALFLVLALVLTYLAAGVVVLYGVLCGVFELRKNRNTPLGVTCILIALAVPAVVAAWSYDIWAAEAYAPLLPWRAGIVRSFSARVTLPERGGAVTLAGALRWTLILFFPLAMLGAAERGRLAEEWRKVLQRLGIPAAPGGPGPRPSGSWSLLSLGVFLAVATLLVSTAPDDTQRKRLLIDVWAEAGQWENVLRTAGRLAPERHDAFVMHDVNRALYHSGRLLSEMFRYPQRFDSEALLLDGEKSRSFDGSYLKSSGILLELGQVNLSEKRTHMALEIFGERPEVLKRLVRINVLNGRLPVARGFLGMLRANLLYRRWADDYLKRLDADPLTASDEEVRRVRTLMPVGEQGPWEVLTGLTTDEDRLRPLLDVNRKNRMAFEYLMASYLLSRQTDKVVANLDRLDDFGYTGIPRHCEEAVLVHQGNHPEQTVDLHGRSISPETRAQLRSFAQAYMPFGNAQGPARRLAFEKLRKDHSHHYFFYFRFRYSIAVTVPFRADAVTGATK